jgi:hypothetical protein
MLEQRTKNCHGPQLRKNVVDREGKERKARERERERMYKATD